MGRWCLDGRPAVTRDAAGKKIWTTRRLARLTECFGMDSEEASSSLSHYRGGDVIDVGAHQGAYCFLLSCKAKPGDRFYAFEPEPVCFPVLQHNLADLGELYGQVRFVGLPVPVGNGAACKFTFPMGEHYHPGVMSSAAGEPGAMPTVRLDDLVRQFGLKPAFVKVDVEGAEVFVIEGMQQVLREYRPVLMVEFHPLFQPGAESLEKAVLMLQQAGYRKVHMVDGPVARREYWLPPDN